MQTTALRWESEPEVDFGWCLQVAKGDVLLVLVGSRHRMTAGVVQAVAEGSTGLVQLQCLLSMKLVFPKTTQRHGMTCAAPLPLPQAKYSGFRAVDLAARPADSQTVEVAAVSSHTCAAMLINLREDMYRPYEQPRTLMADLDACKMGVAGRVAAALAYAKMSSGEKSRFLHCLA